jgi:hypothetical protein
MSRHFVILIYLTTVRIYLTTAEIRLSGLIGTASRPDMQKIRIIGFLFENVLHWQFEAEENF